jgi:chemotaxis protein CheD
MEPGRGDTPKHFLNPCMVFVHREEHLVSTVLGSCVSVCLWDGRMTCGGMNHFMLPLWNGDGLPTPKYGNIAIDILFRRMLDLGCAKERLVAKVFGGSTILKTGAGLYPVGERNVSIAEELLRQQAIPIIAADTGGVQGRKILFNTRSGVVLVGQLGMEGGLLGLPDGRPRPQGGALPKGSIP